MRIEDCELHIEDKLNNCYMTYTDGNVVYYITYEEKLKWYAERTIKRWKFSINYDIQTRRYSDKPFKTRYCKYSSWDSIPKVRKQVAEEMKELYENSILVVKKLEGN